MTRIMNVYEKFIGSGSLPSCLYNNERVPFSMLKKITKMKSILMRKSAN